MGTNSKILDTFRELNEAQKEAVATTEGPLLIIAGPGSGKTLVLVVRALNMLLENLCQPREMVLCTFTEKAAFELRDRIALAAKDMGYQNDLSDLLVGTIHGLCNDFILRNRHKTPLGNNYEVLDELTQLLFLFDNFNKIIGLEEDGHYLGRWTTRWTSIQGASKYFNKITEEFLNPEDLTKSSDSFTEKIGHAYESYEATLIQKNCIDFAHQQKIFYDLIRDPDIGQPVKERVRYLMVDEFQDTNYIQEQLLLELAKIHGNICVVGDEDQSLYRFRGATVRNILEFPKNFPSCHVTNLNINYRSHEKIVQGYNKFMASWDWENPSGSSSFRFDKEIIADPETDFIDYPALYSIWGENKRDETNRFGDCIQFLKKNKVIEDYSQVVLLLHSVKLDHSEPYIKALDERGIPYFCPRAKAYFDNEEVRIMVGCYAILLGYFKDSRGDIRGRSLINLTSFVDQCIVDLGRFYGAPHPLSIHLKKLFSEINELKEGQTLDRRLSDYFYELISFVPFASLLKNENRARNLAIFSQLLNVFQHYYHYTVVTSRNQEYLRLHFFNSFLRLLYEGGINEYEDPNSPLPKGHVQIMTIHQAKGLEFPVVFIGSLDKQLSTAKDVDRYLGPYYHRPLFEPENRITGFDRMRLHYVAFSRAEKILILTTSDQPKPYFNSIWQGLPQWPYIRQDLLKSLFFKLKKRMTPKRTFSFTSDLKVYETCPRQYQFFREYEFTPSRSAEIFFGALVHQTIEDIHRHILDNKGSPIAESKILEWFEFNFNHLINSGIRPIGETQKETAFNQVTSYYHQNRNEMNRVIETEVDVSLEKDNYILVGAIDLLLGADNKLELLDFKSQPRPEAGDPYIESYHLQLCTYAHILEKRYGKQAERLLLYWTGEKEKEDALMVFPYREDLVDAAGERFDQVVGSILNKDFTIKNQPKRKVCAECDIRLYCANDRFIG